MIIILNEYNLKDSFDTVKRIRSIPPELFDKDYQFASFDVQSLFTKVPIKKTSSLGPVLASIILTEFENVIVKPLIETGVLKFYCRYVDETQDKIDQER